MFFYLSSNKYGIHGAKNALSHFVLRLFLLLLYVQKYKNRLKYDIEKNNKHDITHFPPFPAWCGHTLLDVPRQFVERHKRHAFQPHGMELDGSFLVIRDTAADTPRLALEDSP